MAMQLLGDGTLIGGVWAWDPTENAKLRVCKDEAGNKGHERLLAAYAYAAAVTDGGVLVAAARTLTYCS